MTAIAYRDGVMAADTQTTGGGYVRGQSKKIARGPSGTIAAASGQAGWTDQFRRWVVSGTIDDWLAADCEPKLDLKTEHGEFGAIIVQSSGRVTCVDWQGNAVTNLQAPYYVEGSADVLLLGAMAAGATAEEAVRIAIRYDTGCGGDVQVERIE